jgi:hypothetical protein
VTEESRCSATTFVLYETTRHSSYGGMKR